MQRPNPVRFVPYVVLLIAALLGTLPLLLSGPSCGHDFPFHLLNWMDAAHQWRAGVLRPWWCAAAAWNTGEARFLFYPPVSWVLGGLLTLTLGVSRAPAAYTFLALALCGFTMRRFLAGYLRPPLALLGGCLYLAQPYLLFTATERTAYAELLAAAWLPWLLQEALRDRVSARRLAIPVALLWLTNTPSAVLATYTLAIVACLRVVMARRRGEPVIRHLVLPTAGGYAWGVLLSSFYLLPALVQHSAVEVGQAFTAGMMPEESTLFAHTGQPFHDSVVRQASVLALMLLGVAAAAAVALVLQRRRVQRLHGMRDLGVHPGESRRALLPCLLLLTVVVAFLLTPASLPLWHHLPELLFLQFPWRTLMLQGVLTVTLVALALPRNLHLRSAVPLALAAVAALSFTAHRNYMQACDREDAPSSLQAQYDNGAGFEPYDEYTPKDADNDLLHAEEPPAWTAAQASATAPADAASHAHALPDPSPNIVTIQVQPGPSDRYVIVRHRAFRNWYVFLDGAPVRQLADRDDDLIAVPVSGGQRHTVTLRYEWSADQTAGVAISLIALAGLAIRPRRSVSA